MNIVAQPSTAAPVINDVEYAYEIVMGKELWRAGKPISACVNDAQIDGWNEAEDKGAAAYFRCMCDQAEDGEPVDLGRRQ